jgi:hypothetical protein
MNFEDNANAVEGEDWLNLEEAFTISVLTRGQGLFIILLLYSIPGALLVSAKHR